MNKKHAKSPCCGAKIIKYGRKRKQCTQCKKTWTIRPRRRGRKARRIIGRPVERFLRSGHLRKEQGISQRAKYLARLRVDRDSFNRKNLWHPVPQGQIILIADAIVRCYQGRWHTWFFMLVRAVDGKDAIILPPYHREGKETPDGWDEAIDTIPAEVQDRVKALVSDGHTGLMYAAKRHRWFVQRCHAHLLRAIQARRSRWSMGRHRDEATEVHALVKCVLEVRDEPQMKQVLMRIEEIGHATSSKILRKVLLGFVKSAENYRTYLAHPELNLPTTSNTAESLNALVGSLSFHARGFRSVDSLNAWISALCKERGMLKCRGKNQQN